MLQLNWLSLFYIVIFYKVAILLGNHSDEYMYALILFLEIKGQPLDEVSIATPAAVGGTLSACVILIIVVAVLVIR